LSGAICPRRSLAQSGMRINKYYVPGTVRDHYDDELMERAEVVVRLTWDMYYNLFTHNCQDYVYEVIKEYKKLSPCNEK